jgi:DNA-binding SARP family transcriptional activator
MLLECYGDWPAWPESSTRTELRAAVADLRHLQGFLASVGQERQTCSLSPGDIRLSRFASGAARILNRLAGSIERKLAKEA